MFDGYIIDKFTRDVLDEAVKKDKLGFLKSDYLAGLIKELYTNNGIVRVEILGNSRYDVIEIIYYVNLVMAEIISEKVGVEIHFTTANKIIVIEGTNPNSFIIESNANRRCYDYISRGEIKPKIDITLEVVGRKRYAKEKHRYLTLVYDRRYAKKGFLDIVGTIVGAEHYSISDEVAYACLPANHNSTRY